MIRDVRQEDYQEYLAMSRDFYSGGAALHPVPEGNFKETFRRCLAGDPYCRLLMLEHEGKTAGYALLALTYSNEVGGLCVWVDEVFVKEEYRSCGLGRAFFAWLRKTYDSTAKRYRLEVCASNEGAARLYARLGFEPLAYEQMILDR